MPAGGGAGNGGGCRWPIVIAVLALSMTACHSPSGRAEPQSQGRPFAGAPDVSGQCFVLELPEERWVEDTYCVHWGGPQEQYCELHERQCFDDWLESLPCNKTLCA